MEQLWFQKCAGKAHRSRYWSIIFDKSNKRCINTSKTVWQEQASVFTGRKSRWKLYPLCSLMTHDWLDDGSHVQNVSYSLHFCLLLIRPQLKSLFSVPMPLTSDLILKYSLNWNCGILRGTGYFFVLPNSIIVTSHDHLHHRAPAEVSAPASTQWKVGSIKSPS